MKSVYFVQNGLLSASRCAQEMNLCSFLLVIPEDLLAHVVPASRALLVLQANHALRAWGSRLRLSVHVTPSAALVREYNNSTRYVDSFYTAQHFLDRSLHMTAGFHIEHFALENVSVDETSLLAKMLQLSPRLKVLNLHNNRMNEDKMHALLSAVPASLEELRFTKQFIKVCSVEFVGRLVKRLSCLRVLDLTQNYINAAGCKFITSSIASNVLQELALGFNHIKSEQQTPALPNHLGLDRFALTHLDVRHNMLKSNLHNSILKCLAVSAGRLHDLDLSYNDMHAHGVSVLSQSLKSCSALRRLVLAGNSMQNEGFCLLMCVLSPPCVVGGLALHALDVGDNGLTDCAASLFARCLSTNRTLKNTLHDVSFSSNCLYDFGVKTIVEALLPCRMTRLCLSHTKCGECAGIILGSAMQVWSALRVVHVHENHLRDTSLLMIATGLCQNQTKRRELCVRGNFPCTDTIDRLHTMLSASGIQNDASPTLFRVTRLEVSNDRP
jgi:Ran GTPase-activating protein (RanGAP) involved in mRNA processing and transport